MELVNGHPPVHCEVVSEYVDVDAVQVRIRVGQKLTLSSDSLCHFSAALTYRIRMAGTIATVLNWDLPLEQFPIWW